MYSDILANNASDAGAVRRSTPSPSVPERMSGEDGEKKPACGFQSGGESEQTSSWMPKEGFVGFLVNLSLTLVLLLRPPFLHFQMSTRDGKARKARVQTLSSGLRVCPDGAKPGRRCLALRVYLSTTDQHKG
ncbi:hypothetical protein MJG53_011408 [Ovis ammon polii x Ovis aries]|uniref:Uncharacterized protein n=1 Tax=Ovis ammon polii x Ovis aries TaxID=2918886 RepID=A0ACB9USD1_9CETA|nr:hypothetical protein MJG53_011408 [Ovis ammon polii x Ovis aries]